MIAVGINCLFSIAHGVNASALWWLYPATTLSPPYAEWLHGIATFNFVCRSLYYVRDPWL